MSIPITSTTEWFRCIGPTATLQERQAALARLVRLLVGDAAHRLPPPVSLPGRPAPPPAAPPPPVAPTIRYFRQAPPAGKVINAPSKDSDARDPYSREQSECMNARFHHALGRVIARGKEHPPCSIFLRAGRYPDDPRDLLTQIATRYPDREKCLRVFTAAVLDDRRYVRACIEHAFETWRSRAPQ